MKLRKRQKRKTAQALDAAAGITKIWSEWQIGKRAAKSAAKVTKVKKSGLKDKLTSKPVRLAGLAAVVGGAGAAVAKKLKGGGREPIYTPPGGGEPVAPPDVSPPLAIAPEPATPTDATMPQGTRDPAVGAAGLRSGGDDDADGSDVADGSSAADTADATDEPDAAAAAGSGRPAPTVGDVAPAVPTDDPLPEPSIGSAPEPIADERGGEPPAVEADADADADADAEPDADADEPVAEAADVRGASSSSDDD